MGTCALGTQVHASTKLNGENLKDQSKGIQNSNSIENRRKSIQDKGFNMFKIIFNNFILEDSLKISEEELDLPLTSQVLYNSLANSQSTLYAKNTTEVEELPTPGSPESIYSCSVRSFKIHNLFKIE